VTFDALSGESVAAATLAACGVAAAEVASGFETPGVEVEDEAPADPALSASLSLM
jgi:hypothetical protein